MACGSDAQGRRQGLRGRRSAAGLSQLRHGRCPRHHGRRSVRRSDAHRSSQLPEDREALCRRHRGPEHPQQDDADRSSQLGRPGQPLGSVMSSNPNSILDSVKKVLGLDADYTEFDMDIVMHINTTFTTLQQLAVGPKTGFAIVDSSMLWSDYTDNLNLLGAVRTYVYLRVRMLFDPPATSFTIEAFTKQIEELEWRLNVMAEAINPPSQPVPIPVNPWNVWEDLVTRSRFSPRVVIVPYA